MNRYAWLGALPFTLLWVAILGVLVVQGDWPVRADGRLATIDFVPLYAGGRLALEGQAAAAYHWPALQDEIRALGGETWGGWLSPPSLFLAFAPLATLPLTLALLIWLGVTGALFAAAMRSVLPWRGAAVIGFAPPVTLVAAWQGQTSFLAAALVGFALVLLDRRPVLAGMLIGVLTFKPQLGLIFPVLLATERRWASFAAATLTALSLILVSTLAFGWASLAAFIGSLASSGRIYLDPSAAVVWQRSVYGLVAATTGSAPLAWTIHGLAATLVAASVVWVWRRTRGGPAASAAVAAACLLLPPYVIAHDAVLLTVSLGFFARYATRGFLSGEPAFLLVAAVLPVLPLLTPSGAQATLPVAALIVVGLAMRRAWHER